MMLIIAVIKMLQVQKKLLLQLRPTKNRMTYGEKATSYVIWCKQCVSYTRSVWRAILNNQTAAG